MRKSRSFSLRSTLPDSLHPWLRCVRTSLPRSRRNSRKFSSKGPQKHLREIERRATEREERRRGERRRRRDREKEEQTCMYLWRWQLRTETCSGERLFSFEERRREESQGGQTQEQATGDEARLRGGGKTRSLRRKRRKKRKWRGEDQEGKGRRLREKTFKVERFRVKRGHQKQDWRLCFEEEL
ncbi:hypothetical protein TGCAST_362320 [Toxoplasma gondii CAST]|uniref:Uncharacterized protein n=1 Tax=Toxoplasma gondii CAST TaxID=943122 RepID=A0A425HQB4_TOXGO|nr:hypothetical protein TGCAST_362320 [Toxoplasma gondii CAST]